MSSNDNQSFFANLRYDLPSSLVVFLVALPLCLGIALASGAPLFSGIIAGIVGGIVVASISRSSLGVSGPAAGLAAIVANSIQDLGSYEVFLFAVVVAGIIQIILGFLKAGVIGYYFPSAVIKGMLTGIGIIIFLKQIPHAFGYDGDPEGDFSFFQADGHNTFSQLGYMLDNITPGAIVITVISLIILILWERPFIKQNRILGTIPGPLLVVALGVALNVLFTKYPYLSISQDHLVSIPVPESIGGFFNQFDFPDFGQWLNYKVYLTAFIIAIVASLETLLSVEATDKLDPMKRVTPTNRELLAQGVGNVVSGMIGGLPITQVIVRSSANIHSGGKTRTSAIVHGVLLLISAMTIPNLLNLIPLASLAAILLVIGYKLAKPALFVQMYRGGPGQFIPFIVTALVLIYNFLIGIGLGLAVAIVQILWNNFKTPYHFDPDSYVEGEPVKIEFSEDVSFLNKASILNMFNMMPDGAHVIIDTRKTQNLHPDVVEIIQDFSQNAKTRNITLEISGGTQPKNVDSAKILGDVVLDKSKKK